MTLEADLIAASDPFTEQVDLIRLSLSKNQRVRRAVAQNPSAPRQALAKLFKVFPKDVIENPGSALFNMDGHGQLSWVNMRDRLFVAKNVNTTASILSYLGADGNANVRRAVADHRTTPESVLDALASDPSSTVRYGVADNKKTSPYILDRLSHDADHTVVLGVAMNPNTESSVLERLASHSHEDVRYFVAKNNNTPRTALLALASSSEPSFLVHSTARDKLA